MPDKTTTTTMTITGLRDDEELRKRSSSPKNITDFYQNVDKYKTLHQKLYGYSLADDIIYDFDKDTLQEWLLKVEKEVS